MSKGDGKGYLKGAKGIDGHKGEDYTQKGVDKSAQAGMYGRSWWGVGGLKDITGESK